MSLQQVHINIKITEKQREAFLSTREHQFTLFGGAKGGGKSVGGVNIFAKDALNYTDGVFVAMRRNYTDLHDTTVQSFLRFFPSALVVRRTSDKWYCINNNEIWFYAADKSKDVNYEKTRGLEVSGIFVDEASQLDEEFYEVLPSLLRRPAFHRETKEQLRGYVYMTTNPVPGKNWLKRHFIDPQTRKRDGEHNFIQSLPDENPMLPEGYIDRAFSTMTGAMLDMLRHGSWDIEESDFKIIVPSDLESIFVHSRDNHEIIAIGIDVGLGKPDKTVVYCATRTGLLFQYDSFSEYDTMKQVERLYDICKIVAAAHGRVCIDAGSVGKGIADRLQTAFNKVSITPIMFDERPIDESYLTTSGKYANRRAQMYFHARELIQKSAIAVQSGHKPEITVEYNEQLFEEFDNTYYNPTDGKLIIEPKDNIKKRLGRSPDNADAFVLCIQAYNAAKKTMMPVYGVPRTPIRSRKEIEGY